MEAEPDREVGQDSAGRKLDEALLMASLQTYNLFFSLPHLVTIRVFMQTSHNWLRLEDDDDSSVDLLAPSSGNELTPRESKNNDGGIIGLGDVFSGHKQVIYTFQQFREIALTDRALSFRIPPTDETMLADQRQRPDVV